MRKQREREERRLSGLWTRCSQQLCQVCLVPLQHNTDRLQTANRCQGMKRTLPLLPSLPPSLPSPSAGTAVRRHVCQHGHDMNVHASRSHVHAPQVRLPPIQSTHTLHACLGHQATQAKIEIEIMREITAAWLVKESARHTC